MESLELWMQRWGINSTESLQWSGHLQEVLRRWELPGHCQIVLVIFGQQARVLHRCSGRFVCLSASLLRRLLLESKDDQRVWYMVDTCEAKALLSVPGKYLSGVLQRELEEAESPLAAIIPEALTASAATRVV